MSALFERAQKTVVMITSVPVTSAELDTATWLNLSCTIKQASFTAGQKNDIDVTTLCSDETENINWIGPYISIHFLSLNPLLVRRRRYSRGERYPSALCGCHSL